jgi:hypothetical protein
LSSITLSLSCSSGFGCRLFVVYKSLRTGAREFSATPGEPSYADEISMSLVDESCGSIAVRRTAAIGAFATSAVSYAITAKRTNRSHGRLASDRRFWRVRLLAHPLWRRRCLKTHLGPRRPLSAPIWVRSCLAGTVTQNLADYRSVTWGRGEDVQALGSGGRGFSRKAVARTGRDFPIIVIREAGLDGFWIHRCCSPNGLRVMWSTLRRS